MPQKHTACWIHLDLTISCFTGESLAGRTGIPQGYWSFSWVAEDELSFPNNWKPASGELDIVNLAQHDGQALPPLSRKSPLHPIGRDESHQLAITTNKHLCLALPSTLYDHSYSCHAMTIGAFHSSFSMQANLKHAWLCSITNKSMQKRGCSAYILRTSCSSLKILPSDGERFVMLKCKDCRYDC